MALPVRRRGAPPPPPPARRPAHWPLTVGEHPRRPDPVAGQEHVGRSRRVDRRPSDQPSPPGQGEGVGDGHASQEALVQDLVVVQSGQPAQAVELGPIGLGVGVAPRRPVLHDLHHGTAGRGQARQRGMGRQVERLVHAEHDRHRPRPAQPQLQAHRLDRGSEVAEPARGLAEEAGRLGGGQAGEDDARALDRAVDGVRPGGHPVGVHRADRHALVQGAAGRGERLAEPVDDALPTAVEVAHAPQPGLQLGDGRAGVHQVGGIRVGRDPHQRHEEGPDVGREALVVEPPGEAPADEAVGRAAGQADHQPAEGDPAGRPQQRGAGQSRGPVGNRFSAPPRAAWTADDGRPPLGS